MNPDIELPATLIAELADYATAIRIEQVPGPARRQAALCILGTLSCIVSRQLADR